MMTVKILRSTSHCGGQVFKAAVL